MISPETEIDVLAEIAKNTDRIASALESIVNACVKDPNSPSGGFVEIFATTHQS